MFTQLRIPTGIHSATSLPRTQGHLLGTNQPSVGISHVVIFGILGSSEVTNWTMPRWCHQALGISLLLPVCTMDMKAYESPVIWWSDGKITCPFMKTTPSAPVSQLSRNAPRSRRRSLMPPGTSGNKREDELTWFTCGKGDISPWKSSNL